MNHEKTGIARKLVAALFGICACVSGNGLMAANDCQPFTLVSDVTLLLSPVPSGIAIAELTLEDGTVYPIVGEGIITEMKTSDEGIIHMSIRELDDWGVLGSSIGLDGIKLTPTAIPGEFSVKIKTGLIGDSGEVANILGKYHGDGTASFNTFTLHHSGTGKICDLP